MAALAPPVQVVASGAPPFVAVSGNAPPFVVTTGPAPPITIVASGAPPITLLNDDGSLWTGGAATTPVNTVAPVASGTVNVGDVLTVTTGSWTNSPTSYTYRWRQDGVDIPSAVTNTHTLLLVEVGSMIDCRVTATNADGSGSANSNALGPVITAAPLLSAASAVDFSDIFVWGQATTSTNTGTLYAVVVAGAATTPTAAQIIAGTDAAGAAAPNASVAVTASGVQQVLVRGLTAVTSYKVCMAHQASGLNSNVVTGAFTTDTFVAQWAHNGAATGLTFSTGSAAAGLSQADPFGGTNAIRWTDSNDAGFGGVLISSTAVTVFSGVNKVHMTWKYQGGSQWIRFLIGGITASTGNIHMNIATGALGVTHAAWGTPKVFSVGAGWFQWSGVADLTGADVSGNHNINKCSADNVATVTRNGTHIADLYNLRITRV
jgi:hypothetical protein